MRGARFTVSAKAVLLITLLVVIAGVIYAVNTQISLLQQQERERMRIEATELTDFFAKSLQVTSAKISGVIAFLEGSDEVSEREFATYIEKSDFFSEGDHLRAIAVLPVLEPDDADFFNRVLHERQITRDQMGYPHWAGAKNDAKGQSIPVTYAEPPSGRQNVVGFDIATSPERMKAAIRAQETSSISMSAPVRLSQDASNKSQSVLLLGYTRRGHLGFRSKNNIQLYPTYVAVGYTPSVHIASMLSDNSLGFWVRAVDATNKDNPIKLFEDAIDPQAELLSFHEISFVGRDWRLEYYVDPKGLDPVPAWLIGLAALSILLSLALAYGINQLIDSERSLARRVRDRTEKLRESEYRLSLHMQNTPVGAISWDREFICTEWNKAAENIFGFSSVEAIGTHPAEMIIPETIRSDIDEVYAALLNQEGGSRNTNENLTKDGRTIICDWYNTPILGRNGEVIGVASLVQDITERKRTEAELIEAKKEAEAANKAKSDFLAAMSHELRTPLNAIAGFAQMIEKQVLGKLENEKYAEYASDITFSANHLVSLVNDILDLSKIEAKKIELNPTRFSVNSAIRDAVNLTLKNSLRSEEMIRVKLEHNVEHLTSDLRSFRQIMVNLLSNADKYSDNDTVITVSGRRSQDNEIIIEVSDQGIGISPQDLEHIIEPFNQSRKNAEIAHSGTGLGLTISKRLMELNGGTLKIESELGNGTNVILTFPDLD